MPEYAFDAPAMTAVRISAESVADARAKLAEMQAVEVNLEHRNGAVLTELSVHAEDATVFEVDGEDITAVDAVDGVVVARDGDEPVLVIALDPTGTETVAVPVSTLSRASRHLIAQTLRQVERAECENTIVEEVEKLLAATFPDRPARGAVFGVADYDGDLYVRDGSAAVLFADGTADEHAMFYDRIFHDQSDRLRQAFHDYGRLHDTEATVAVDLMARTVSLEKTFFEGTLHERFGMPEPTDDLEGSG